MYNWLRKNRLFNIVLVFAYLIAVILSHSYVGRLINGLFDNVSRDHYNLIIACVVICFALVGLYLLKDTLLKATRSLLIYISITVLLVILCFSILMVINVESIHFVQYAILAVMLLPLLEDYLSVMVFAVLVGAIDELYQYLVLDTSAFYYDFNDVLLDAIGAGIGLLIMRIKGVDQHSYIKKLYKKPAFVVPTIISAGLIVCYLAGWFSVNATFPVPTPFTLFKKVPEGFWYYPRGPYARFHILHPIPGLLLTSTVVWYYGRLGKVQLIAE